MEEILIAYSERAKKEHENILVALFQEWAAMAPL